MEKMNRNKGEGTSRLKSSTLVVIVVSALTILSLAAIFYALLNA